MILDVWAPLVLPLLLALPLLRTLPDRLPPRLATWLFTATAVGAACASTAALGLLALAGVLHLPFVAALGHLDLPVARQLDPDAVVPVGAAASALLAVLAVRAARVTARHLRDHATARRLVSSTAGVGTELVVLPDARPDAYAVPAGRRSRIVVTAGMLGALDAREREVLLAHERAHLRCGHHRFLLLVDLAVALHPLLGRVRDGVAYSIERWADERAATEVADRRLAARAIGRAAIAGARAPRPVVGLAVTSGPVPRRVAALLARPRALTRAAVVAAGLLLAVPAVSMASALDAAHDLHQQVELAQR